MARLRFGLRVKATLNCWGLHACEDVGEVVFNLVNSGFLGKGPDDCIGNFQSGYSFDEAFPEN